MADVVPLDHLDVLNYAAKYLARDIGPPRHNYGQYLDPADPRAAICEAWRFPIVSSCASPASAGGANRVTFVFVDASPAPTHVQVIGSFGLMYAPVDLERVVFLGDDTIYRAVSLIVPAGQLHRYLFLVDGRPTLDPINPQRVVLDNGVTWSQLFTERCTQPVSFDPKDLALLNRLTDHILPFRTPDAQRFLQYFYNSLDQNAKETQYANAYRLDQPVGVVNFIDKLLASHESHHAIDYSLCLELIGAVLRARHPGMEPETVPRETYDDLFTAMGLGKVDGWDYGRYQDPAYFLKLLRRHTYTGAFCHPRQGGNVGAAGWAYLKESYRGPNGESCFEWEKAIEPPFGTNDTYLG